MFDIPENVQKVLDRLHSAGYEAFIVGGCVRDCLLGVQPKDMDVTTNAKPPEVKAALKGMHVIDTGIKHGTVTAVVNKEPIEITTYRIETEYSDNRHPDKVFFTSDFKDDASRRDFTINAMAYAPETGVVDHFGGRDDLRRRLIRCVGSAAERFDEDGLRIMRALRFASVLGFDIEPETSAAVHEKRELLKNISAERIAAELKKTLCGRNVRKIVMEYIDVFSVVIPELAAMEGFDQLTHYHVYDVLEHTMAVVEAIEPVVHLRLAAFLHDIGKPHCRTIGEDGTGHFYGHAEISYKLSKEILGRLKLDNFTTERVLSLVRHHSDTIEPNTKSVKRALNRLGPDVFYDLVKLKIADNRGKSPFVADRENSLAELAAIADRIIEESNCFSLRELAVNGNDVAALGFRGKDIGKALNFLLEAVIDERVENEKNALESYLSANESGEE